MLLARPAWNWRALQQPIDRPRIIVNGAQFVADVEKTSPADRVPWLVERPFERAGCATIAACGASPVLQSEFKSRIV
jgi:hypothetical protein